MESRRNSRGFVGCYMNSDHASVMTASSTTASTDSLRPPSLSKVSSLPSSALSSSSSSSSHVEWGGCCADTTTATTSSTAAPTPRAPPVTPSSLCLSAGEVFFSYAKSIHPSPSSFSLAPSPECPPPSESSPSGSHGGNSGRLYEGLVGGDGSSVTQEHCCELGEGLTRPSKENHSTSTVGEGSTQNDHLHHPGGECLSIPSQPSDPPQSTLSAPSCRPTSGHSLETTGEGSSSAVYPPSSAGSGEVYLEERSCHSSQQMIRGMSLNRNKSLNEDTSNRSTSCHAVGPLAGPGLVGGTFGSSLFFPVTTTTTPSTLDDFGKTASQFCATGLGCISSQTTSFSLCSSTRSSDSICADSSPTTTSTTIGPQHQHQQQAPSTKHQQRTQNEDTNNNNSNNNTSPSSSISPRLSLSSFPPFFSPLGTEGVLGNTAGPPFADFAPRPAFCTMGTDGGLFFAPSQNSTNALPSPANPPGGGGGGTTPTGATGGGVAVVGGGVGSHQHSSVFLPSAQCGASGAPPPPQQQQQQVGAGGGNAGNTLFGGGGQPGGNGSSNSNNATTGLPSQQQAFASSPRMIGGGNSNNNPGGCLLPSAGSNCYGLPYSFTGACGGWPSPPLSLNPSSLLLSGPSGGMISPVHSNDGRFAITSLSRPPDGTADLSSSNSSSALSSQPQPSSSVRGGEGGTGGGGGLSQGAPPPPALQCLGLGGTPTAGGANMMGFPQQVQMNSSDGNTTANPCGLPGGSIPALAGGGMMSPSMMLGPPVGGGTSGGAPGGGVPQQQMMGAHLGSGLTGTGGGAGGAPASSGPDGLSLFPIGAGGAMMGHTTTATTHLQSAGFSPAGTPPSTGGGGAGLVGGGGSASNVGGTTEADGGASSSSGHGSALDIALPKKYSGIWFDPQQNCWRASWVCAKTGKRKFRYFSAAKFGHQHALHLAKMTKERAMERKKVRLQAEASERQRAAGGDPSAGSSSVEGDGSVFGSDDGTTTTGTGGGKEGEGGNPTNNNNNSNAAGGPPRGSRSRYALEAEVLRLVKPDDDGMGVRLGEDSVEGDAGDGGANSSSSTGDVDGSIGGGAEDHQQHSSTDPNNDAGDNEPESQEPSVLAARAKEMLKVPGVYYDSARMIWRAFWHEGGRRVIRYFTVNKHGFKRAHELALLTRRQAALAMQQRRRQATAGLVLAANEGGGNGSLPSPLLNSGNTTSDGTPANTPTMGAGALGKPSSSSSSLAEETASISIPSGLLTSSTPCNNSTGNGQTSTGGGENHLMNNHSGGGGATSAGGGGSDGIPGAAQSAQASSSPPGHSPCGGGGGLQPPATSGSLGRPPNSLGNITSGGGRAENGIVAFGNSREGGGGSELLNHHNSLVSSDGTANSLQSSSPANYGVRQIGGSGNGGVVLGGGGGEGSPGDANGLAASGGLVGGPVPPPGGAGGQGFFPFLPQIPQGAAAGEGTDHGRNGGDLTTGGVPPPHHPLLYPIPPAVSSAATGDVGGSQSDMSQQSHLGLATTTTTTTSSAARVGGGETGSLVGVLGGGGDSITPTGMLGSHHRGTLDIPISPPPECPTSSPNGSSAGAPAPSSSSSSPSGVVARGGNPTASSSGSSGGSSSGSSSSGGGGNSRVDYLERVSLLPREDQVEWSEEFKAWVVTPPQVPDDQFFPTSRVKHEQQGGGGGAPGGKVQYTAEGREILKMFTIRKYGFRVARERAIEWRNRRREKAKLEKEQYKPKQQAPNVSVPGLLMAGTTAAGNSALRPSPVGGDHPGIMGVAGLGTLRHPAGHLSPYPPGQENMFMGFGVSLVGANPVAASKAMLQIQQQQQLPPTANVQLGDPRSAASPSFSTSTTCSSNPRSPPSSLGPGQQPHLNHMMMGATGGCVTPFPSPDPSAASAFLRMSGAGGGGGGTGASAGGASHPHPPPPPPQQQQPSSDGRSASTANNMMLNPSSTTATTGTTTNTSVPSSLLCPSPGLVPPSSLPPVMGHGGPGTAVSATQNPFFPFSSQPTPNAFVSSPFSTMSFPTTNPQQTASGAFPTTTTSLHSPPCTGPPSSPMASSGVTIPPPSSAAGGPASTAAAAAAAAALSGPSPAQLLLQQQQEQQRQQRQQMQQQQQQQGLNKGSGAAGGGGGEGGSHRHGGDSCGGGGGSHSGSGGNGGGGGSVDDEMSGGEASVEAVGVMRNAVSHILRNLQEVCIPGLLCSCTLESDSFNYLAARLDEWTRAVHAHRQLCGSVLSNPEKALEVEKKKRKDNNGSSSSGDKAKGVKQEDDRHLQSHQGPNSDMEGTKKKGNHEDEGRQQQSSSSTADPATDPQAATMVLAPYLKLFAQCIRKNRLPNEMEAEVQVLLLDALVHLGALSGFKGPAGGGGMLMPTPVAAPGAPLPHSHQPHHHPHSQQQPPPPHQQQQQASHHSSPTASSLTTPSAAGQQQQQQQSQQQQLSSSPPQAPPAGSVSSHGGSMPPFQQQISTMSGGSSLDSTTASESQRCGGNSLAGLGGALSQPLLVPLPSLRMKTEKEEAYGRLKEEKAALVKTEDGGSMMANMMRGIDEGESSSSGGSFSCLSVTGTPVNNDSSSSMPVSFPRQSEEEAGPRRGGEDHPSEGQLHHIGSQAHVSPGHFHGALTTTTSTTTTAAPAANGSRGGISSNLEEEGSEAGRQSVGAMGSAPHSQQRNGEEGNHHLEERKPGSGEGTRMQGDLVNLPGGNLCCSISNNSPPVTGMGATTSSFMMTGRPSSSLDTEGEGASSSTSSATTSNNNNNNTADDVSRLGGKKRVAAGDDLDGKNKDVEERERKRSVGSNTAGGGALPPGAAGGVGTLSAGIVGGVDRLESLQRDRRAEGEKHSQGGVVRGGVVATSLSSEQRQILFDCKIGGTATGNGGDGEGSSGEMTGLLPSSSSPSAFSSDLIMFRTTNGDEKTRGNGGGGDGMNNADEETRAGLMLNTSPSHGSHNIRNEKGEQDPLQQQQQQVVYIEG